MAFFATAIVVTDKHKLPKRYIEFGKLCFGVYIWQQFILEIIYYETDAPNMVGSSLIPWLGFTFSLVVSLSLSHVSKKI